jgi:hypothetical protein
MSLDLGHASNGTGQLNASEEPLWEKVSLNDFFTGLIAGLAHERVETVTIEGPSFYKAVVEVFRRLEDQAEDRHLNLRFWLTQDETHQDSPDVRDGITSAVQRRLVSLDNPTYQRMRLKIDAEEADEYLDGVPGGRDLFIQLATIFKDEYRAYA